jgi:dienelactone hydrolase
VDLKRFRPVFGVVFRFLSACGPRKEAAVAVEELPELPKTGPEGDVPSFVDPGSAFVKARAEHPTRIVRVVQAGTPPQEGAPPAPTPATGFEATVYPGRLGAMHAYRSKDPGDSKKHPLVVWAHGNFNGGIDVGEMGRLEPQNPNRQSGAITATFRKQGIAVLIPTFRGESGNPGRYEALFGEVDDFLAAAAYGAALPWVDAEQVYFAGHSTGGALVLLASAASRRHVATFAFGPVARVRDYGPKIAPFSTTGAGASREWELRNPEQWVHAIQAPVFLMEGADGGNAEDIPLLMKAMRSQDLALQGRVYEGFTHVSILGPGGDFAAAKIASNRPVTDWVLPTKF